MKYKSIISIFFVTSLFIGCSLDEEIKDTAVADNYIVTSADVALFLDGIYGSLENPNLFITQAYYMSELTADHISSVLSSYSPYAQKKYEPGYSQIQWVYWKLYGVVGNCNFLLDKLNSLDIDPTFKKEAEGETRFFRALTYFYLVRFYGEIPLRTEPTSSDSDLRISKNSVEEIYDLILSDFKTSAESLLPKSEPALSGLGLANKEAAQAMLSKAYLTYGNMLDLIGKAMEANEAYGYAKSYADSIILSNEYSLMPNYADLWNVNNETEIYNTEVIFGLHYTRDLGGSLGSRYAAIYMPRNMPNVCGNPNQGLGLENWKIQPWFYDVCSTGDYLNDYRSEVTFLTQYVNSGGITTVTYPLIPASGMAVKTQPYLYKYVDSEGVATSNNENDLFVIRLSEVYLIKAEAENELNGPTEEAYDAFNKLRERARLADGTARNNPANLTAGLTKDQFRMKIFEERGLEFVGEGQRWFDLVRMKSPDGNTMYQYMFETVLPNLESGLPKWNATKKVWEGGKTEASNIVTYNSKFLLFPFPQREIDVNPELTQNPGY